MSVRGELSDVSISPESALFVVATVTFINDSDQVMKVIRYRIVWNQGTVESRPKDLVLAAHSRSHRRIRVTPAAGDLKKLVEQKNARIDVQEIRPE